MKSEKQLGKIQKKLKLSVDTSYTSLHSQNSKKKFLSVITPSNKPAKKQKTIKEIKLQVTAPQSTAILSIKDIVKEKRTYTKEEGQQRVQKWKQESKNEEIKEPNGETTIGADSALKWQQPETPISKLINEKTFFKP